MFHAQYLNINLDRFIYWQKYNTNMNMKYPKKYLLENV